MCFFQCCHALVPLCSNLLQIRSLATELNSDIAELLCALVKLPGQELHAPLETHRAESVRLHWGLRRHALQSRSSIHGLYGRCVRLHVTGRCQQRQFHVYVHNRRARSIPVELAGFLLLSRPFETQLLEQYPEQHLPPCFPLCCFFCAGPLANLRTPTPYLLDVHVKLQKRIFQLQLTRMQPLRAS